MFFLSQLWTTVYSNTFFPSCSPEWSFFLWMFSGQIPTPTPHGNSRQKPQMPNIEDQKYSDWQWNYPPTHICTYLCVFVRTRSRVPKDTKTDLIFSCSQMVTSHPCSQESHKPYSEASQIWLKRCAGPRASPFAHRWNPPKFFIMWGKKWGLSNKINSNNNTLHF